MHTAANGRRIGITSLRSGGKIAGRIANDAPANKRATSHDLKTRNFNRLTPAQSLRIKKRPRTMSDLSVQNLMGKTDDF